MPRQFPSHRHHTSCGAETTPDDEPPEVDGKTFSWAWTLRELDESAPDRNSTTKEQ